jgi:hypothetical protein
VLFLEHYCFGEVDRILYAPKLKHFFLEQCLYTVLREVLPVAWQCLLQPEFCALSPYTAPDSTKSKFHYFDIIFLRYDPVYNNFSSQYECNVDGWIIFYKALYSTKLVILSKLEIYNSRDYIIKGCKLHELNRSSISFISLFVKYIILCHGLLYNP